jgi:hypothetical protein
MPDELPRKPLAKALPPMAQKRRPRTVYFSDFEWDRIIQAGRRKMLEPSPFVRAATNRVAKMLLAQADEEASWDMVEGWR